MNDDKQYLVMVIDDDADTVALMKSQISFLYDVTVAYGGREAIEKLSSLTDNDRKPDLILLDINMPEMDGYATLENIRKHPYCKNIPVVFLSGMTDEQYEYNGLQTDAADYLKKPIAGRLLLARIHHYIELHVARKNEEILDMNRINDIPEPLTEREMEVANLMAEFRSNREISELLHISIPYVKKLVTNIKEKLELEKRGDIRKYFIKKT